MHFAKFFPHALTHALLFLNLKKSILLITLLTKRDADFEAVNCDLRDAGGWQ